MSKKDKKKIDESEDVKKQNNKKDETKAISEETKEEPKKPRRSLISYFIILVLIIAIVFLYAKYVGIKGLKVKEYNIINENIPSSFDGFSIVQFSDLELGTTFSLEDLEDMVEKINSLNPEVVVFTGDLTKSYFKITNDEKKYLIETLGKIDPLIGKYSIRGDDDFEGSLYDEVMESAGFVDLTNSYELIYYKGLTPIVLYGLGSLIQENQDFSKTFSYPSEGEDTSYMATYRILLVHEPDTADSVLEYNVSLMLSGHSHNSEINIPYIRDYYNIKGASNYYNPEYKVGGMELYVSSGLGTSKYGMRLLSKPSISIFRLYTD